MTDPSEPQAPAHPPQYEPAPIYQGPPQQYDYSGYSPPPAPLGPVPTATPPKSRRTGLIITAGAGALILVGAGIGVGVAVAGGGSDKPAALATTTAPSYASPASDVPTLTDPTDIAGTPAEEAPPPASNLALGGTLPLQSTNSTTGDISTANVIVYGIEEHAKSTNEFEVPSGQYVKVDVGTTGTSTASFPYNEFDFTLQDTSGQIYQPASAAGFDPSYSSGDVAQGQTVRGYVVFDIPATATVKQANYQVPSGVLGSWALP